MSKSPTDLTRRELLARTATGVASLGLVGLSGKILPACATGPAATGPTPGTAPTAADKVIARSLGKTGIQVPIVGMGVMNTLDAALVRKSYELGVRHFDTAARYQRGRNEEMLGRAIQEMKVRPQVVIATKAFIPPPQRSLPAAQVKEAFLQSAHESLRRLRTDYVDILYCHNVHDLDWLNHPGMIEALRLLKQQGKARFIGFTTHAHMNACIQDAVRSGVFEVILTTLNYALHDDPTYLATLRKAADRGIGLIAMKTQCKQSMFAREAPERRDHYRRPILHTALLKWVLRHDFIGCAVPGYTSFREMQEDLSVARGLDYTAEEQKFLADRGVQVALSRVCVQCGQCRATCPAGVDVPELVRAHMYAVSYGNRAEAEDVLGLLPGPSGLERCASCRECAARCARAVPIGGRLRELKALFA